MIVLKKGIQVKLNIWVWNDVYIYWTIEQLDKTICIQDNSTSIYYSTKNLNRITFIS